MADLFAEPRDGGPAVGTGRRSSPPGNDLGPVAAEYLYRDLDRSTRYRVTRHAPKTFRPWRPDGRGGWALGLGDVAPCPYRWPELADADAGEPVFNPEGERDADNLAAHGLVATTNSGGASGKWTEAHTEALRGRAVVILPDNDAPGRERAERVAAALYGTAASVKVLALPDLPAHGDVTDWLAAGGTAEELRRLAEVAPEWAPRADATSEGTPPGRALRFRTGREIAENTPDAPAWLAEPYVAAGAITELIGKPKQGKSTLLLYLCRRVLAGDAFLGRPTARGPVVYLTEQTGSSLREVLKRADLLDRDDLHLLSWHDARGVPWPEVVAGSVAKAHEVRAPLLVVDTMPQFAGLRGDTENNAGEALEAVQPLQAAAAAGLAVVTVRHERKSAGDVADSGRGSSAFAGAVDVVLSLRRAEGASRPTIRHLHALSRFDATPELLVIEWRAGTYVALGDETAVAEAEAREQILAAAPTDEAAALPEKDLLEAAAVKRTEGRAAIGVHLAGGRLVRVGAGKRNDPYRYWRPEGTEKDADETEGVPSESNGRGRGALRLVADALGHGVPSESITAHGTGAQDAQEWEEVVF